MEIINNNKLYNSVWNNLYLKNKIIDKLTNHYYSGLRKFNSIQQLLAFENLQDLDQVELNFEVNDLVISKLPTNIHSITVPSSLFNVSSLQDTSIISLHLVDSKDNKGAEDLDIFQRVVGLNSLKSLKITCGQENIGYPEIYSLPSELTSLSIEIPTYEHPIAAGVLPSTLKRIYFRFSKISLVNDFIPYDSLKSLTLYSKILIPYGYVFNGQSLSNLELLGYPKLVYPDYEPVGPKVVFPESLESLRIQSELQDRPEFLYPTGDIFPNNLKSLSINIRSFVENGISILPENLESFVFNEGSEHLETIGGILQDGTPFRFPETLVYLDLGYSYNKEIEVGQLPSGLKTLILGEAFRKRINPAAIPFGLELLEMKFGGPYAHYLPLELSNPNTIISNRDYHIQFASNPHQLIHYKIPYIARDFELLGISSVLSKAINLESLDLNNSLFNQDLTNSIPKNNKIKKITLGDNFNHSINLQDYQQLQTLIINNSNPILSTSSSNDFYSLKEIIVPYSNVEFLDSLDKIFIQFIKIIKINTQIKVKYL